MEENTNTTPQTEAEAPAQEIDLENVTLEELEARVNQEMAANTPEEETATVEEVLGIQTPQEERDDGEPEDTAPEEVPAEPPAIQAYENIEDDPRFQEVFNRVLGDRLRKERAKLAKAQRENDEMVQLLRIRDPKITAERLRQQVWEELADETGLDSKAIQLLQRLVGGNQPMPVAEQEEHEAPEAPAAPTAANRPLDSIMPTLHEMMEEGLLKSGDIEAIGKTNADTIARLAAGEDPRKVLTKTLLQRRTQEAQTAAAARREQRNRRVPAPVSAAPIKGGRISIEDMTLEQMEALEDAARRGKKVLLE